MRGRPGDQPTDEHTLGEPTRAGFDQPADAFAMLINRLIRSSAEALIQRELINPLIAGEPQSIPRHQHPTMPATDRLRARISERVDRVLSGLGRELRAARLSRGLSQRIVAHAAGISQGQLSHVERGTYPTAPLSTFLAVAAALGLELSVRAFPAGEPIRDKAHAALLDRFRKAVGEAWQWAAEVPLPIPGDRRAWDRTMRRPQLLIGVEAETRPTDMQELQRRLALKKRDGQVDRLLLVLADTDWCRRVIRLNDIETMFPVAGKVALRALLEGRDPGGDSVVLV